MTTIALIGCSGSKLDRIAPARELYTGALFRLSVRYAEEVLRCPWGVLSARHGLVLPEALLAPYDDRLPTKRAELDNWGRETAVEIDAVFGPFDVTSELVLLAGEAYGICRRHVPWTRRGCWREPLRRMQIGERLRWLKNQLEGAKR